ncbi:hypothetical protein ABEB36_005371 [Hypothenemus hampei]|uniref:Odorant receptor n=1 Tax=Hypothenemus hampei TaxID=57062 RepID=A0ABD1EY56_HYPHA
MVFSYKQTANCKKLIRVKWMNHRRSYGFFYYCLCTSFPVFSAAIYQFWVRIDDLKILLEALVGVGNITGYIIAYVCFLKKQKQIEELLYDFKQFIEFSELKLIEETERKVAKYTKYLLTYVTVGLMLNFIWQMFTTESCELQRGSEFYVKHDPCWMPVRNIYPFDASDRKYFWVVFPIESIYAYHISCFFSLATSTVMGFLMHISAQFKCCLDKFDHVFDDVEDNEISHNKKLDEFIGIIIYHQRILVYVFITNHSI